MVGASPTTKSAVVRKWAGFSWRPKCKTLASLLTNRAYKPPMSSVRGLRATRASPTESGIPTADAIRRCDLAVHPPPRSDTRSDVQTGMMPRLQGCQSIPTRSALPKERARCPAKFQQPRREGCLSINGPYNGFAPRDCIDHETSRVSYANDRTSVVLAVGDTPNELPPETRHLHDGRRATAISASILR